MNEYDILFIGTALIDSIIKGFNPEPISASGFKAESGSLNVGGESVNGSIAAAKLGMKTAILCHLGKDAAGAIIEKELANNGVNVEFIVKSNEYSTPITTMFVAEDGTRKSITNKTHRYNFHPEQYIDIFSNTKALVLGSLFRAPFDDSEVLRNVVKKAHEKGMIIFADTKLPNYRKLSLEDIADSLAMIDYITPNEDEGRYYSGENNPEKMAEVFINTGVKNVIVKLGNKGCLFKNKEELIALPAYNIDAVDATGAGDNFLAGFASEIIRGNDNKTALKYANACGAICTTAVGANTALRNRQQVWDFMNMYRK